MGEHPILEVGVQVSVVMNGTVQIVGVVTHTLMHMQPHTVYLIVLGRLVRVTFNVKYSLLHSPPLEQSRPLTRLTQ